MKLRFRAHLIQFFLPILNMVSESHRKHLNPIYDQKLVSANLRNFDMRRMAQIKATMLLVTKIFCLIKFDHVMVHDGLAWFTP